uniref:Uncharacterized protein n=1 Tax=Aegilops tauschii subsp. strangulata TaxID=200361 RepID=A0A453L1B1_AEGTS
MSDCRRAVNENVSCNRLSTFHYYVHIIFLQVSEIIICYFDLTFRMSSSCVIVSRSISVIVLGLLPICNFEKVNVNICKNMNNKLL